MEKKKMKLWKKILLVILVVFVIFSIFVLRNYIIISKLENVSQNTSIKTNYIANIYSLQNNSTNITKSYNKNGNYLTSMQVYSTEFENLRKFTIYKNSNEEIGIIQSGDTKIAILNGNMLGGSVQLNTFMGFGNEYNMNVWEKLILSVTSKITTDECNNKDCYLVEIPHWKMWVDKETGLLVRDINGGMVTERFYEFDAVKDEDISKPDISDCKIQE